MMYLQQVAHDAIRQAAIKDGIDYISNGFVARSQDEELKGADYEVFQCYCFYPC
jgi:hypothetical protein